MLTVILPPDIEEYVRQVVADGRYRSEQEVVLDAVRLLRDTGLRYQQLRGQVRDALESVDRGEAIEMEGDEALAAFFDELESEVRADLAAEKHTPG